ncbi:hypothetical protein CNR22_08460 [Sphingobacteriaceae bacterium]|nr:hypothetical protein CNR22_08460 [Sphingobacteriaceae bacterium]
MKSTVKQLSKLKGLGDIETPENNPILLHFLSPLELAAYKNKFQPFKYNLDGVILDIEPNMSKELYWQSKRRATAIRQLLQKSKQKILKQDPELKRFLHKPLKHHNLPTRIYHVLKGNGCYNMAEVAQKGEAGLKRMRGMGKVQIAHIMKLFMDNGCGDLFL